MSRAPSRRIAVLMHAGDRHLPMDRYIVHHLAQTWRDDGHAVQFVFGVDSFEPADLALVHVNLSVVPDQYLRFAARYPITLNAKIADIRKSTISPNIVGAGDDWGGPVIVKSELNYAGLPEKALNRSWLDRRSRTVSRVLRVVNRWLGRDSPFAHATDYEVYEHLSEVPPATFSNRHLVVERFLPEMEDGLYFTRVFQFLGDRWSCTRMGSPLPIVKGSNCVRVEAVEPHQEVREWRRQLGMDYGKLDYVVHAGRPVLLDVNKTIGASRYDSAGDRFDTERIRAGRRALAQGIYSYF